MTTIPIKIKSNILGTDQIYLNQSLGSIFYSDSVYCFTHITWCKVMGYAGSLENTFSKFWNNGKVERMGIFQ